MNKSGIMSKVLVVCLLLGTAPLYGQKLKFKDIYLFLSTKRYEEAEPFLKRYLVEHDDEPKAHMYMGFIYHEKALKDDILKETRLGVLHSDSAILFLDKANKMMTEKELKRNEEYYQAYNRRDLRTGEFGVKLSDIQYDLEKRIESLRERTDRIKMVKYYFTLTDSMYRKANRNYRHIQDLYPGMREMLLRADTETVTRLSAIKNQYDSATKAFENYRSSVSLLGKTGYNPTATTREIADLKKDGTVGVDFYQNELELWDYGKFAEKAKEVLEQDIFPMQKHLIDYDIAINKLREKSSKDSISVRSDLTKLIDRMLMEKLKRYDPRPMPMEVFNLKISDLEYRSVLIEHRVHRDSADLYLQRKMVNEEIRYATKLDSVAQQFGNLDLEREADNYAAFMRDTYGTISVLRSFGHAVKQFASKELELKNERLKKVEASLQWVCTPTDSIPLFDKPDYKTKSLAIIPDKYLVALVFNDSTTTTGWLYSLTPTRKPDLSFSFRLPDTSYKKALSSRLSGLLYAEPNGQLFFPMVVNTTATTESKYQVAISKIYRTDGLAWTSEIHTGFIPKEIQYRADTAELTLRDGEYTVVIDKNGKVIR